jgi:hypothetical protein
MHHNHEVAPYHTHTHENPKILTTTAYIMPATLPPPLTAFPLVPQAILQTMQDAKGWASTCVFCKFSGNHPFDRCPHMVQRCRRCLGEGHFTRVCPFNAQDGKVGCWKCTLPYDLHESRNTTIGKSCAFAPVDCVEQACWTFLRLPVRRLTWLVDKLGNHLPPSLDALKGKRQVSDREIEQMWYSWMHELWVQDGQITNGAVLFHLLHRQRKDSEEAERGLELSK